MNQGYVGSEIAEMIEMPPALDAVWHTHRDRLVSHNVEGSTSATSAGTTATRLTSGSTRRRPPPLATPAPSAASRRPWPRRGSSPRRPPAVRGRTCQPRGVRRPARRAGRALLDDVLTRLGYGAERATWRNNYLTGAQELRAAPGGNGAARPGRARADRHPALRQPRDSDRRQARVGCQHLDPLAPHRLRRDLPDGAQQRRPDPLSDQARRAGQRGHHAHPPAASGDAGGRRDLLGAVQGAPQGLRHHRRVHRSALPQLRDRHP